jgi:GT2 family glycosyltransferase
MPDVTPTVAIVIPTYGAFDFARVAVGSAYRNTPNPLIVLVDDGSPRWGDLHAFDKLTAGIPTERMVVQRYNSNHGCTHAWNAGLRLADAANVEYVVLGNSDLYFPVGWWAGMALALDTMDIVGPLTNAPGHVESQRYTVRGFRQRDLETPAQADALAAEVARGDQPAAMPCRYVNGCCWAARLTTWRAVAFDARHVLDPGKRNTGNEDECQRRARSAGKRVAIAARSFVLHFRSATRGARDRPINRGALPLTEAFRLAAVF